MAELLAPAVPPCDHPPMPDGPPPDPADHAEDFSRRYFLEMDYLSAQRMRDLKVPDRQIGSHIPLKGHATFIPTERSGGGNDALGGLTLDSGVFNPELSGTLPGAEEWAMARLCDHMDAAIAHEHEEARREGSHVEALKHAPDTELPIREGARHILRAMKGRER